MDEYLKEQIKRLWCAKVPINDIVKMLPCREVDGRKAIKEMRASGELKGDMRKRDIRAVLVDLFASGKNSMEVADELKISLLTLYNYCSRFSVPITRPKRNYKKRETKIESLSKKTQDILSDLKSGISGSEIAKKHGVSRQYVSSIKIKYMGEKQ